MSTLTGEWIGKKVRVYRGAKYIAGVVVDVKSDFIALWNEEEGLTYIATDHIQSICQAVKSDSAFSVETENLVIPELIEAESLSQCAKSLTYKWVRVNEGPERVEGVLVEVTDDQFSVVSDQEVRRYFMAHIKSLSPGPKPEKQKQTENVVTESAQVNNQGETSAKQGNDNDGSKEKANAGEQKENKEKEKDKDKDKGKSKDKDKERSKDKDKDKKK